MKRAVSIALAGLGLTLLAQTFDTAPLLVPGIALLVIGVAAPLWVWLASRGASVERHLQQRRVIEGEPLEATIVVRAPRIALIAAALHEPLASGAITLPPGQRTRSLGVALRLGRRGRHAVMPPSLTLHDPLELARRVIVARGGATEVLVLPRTSVVHSLVAGSGGRGSERSGTRTEALAAVDFDGLRPYRPGTPAARIHWPALARGAGLLERRLRAETDTRPLVVLDARGASDPEHLDQAVRAAASLTLELARAGGCGLLLPGDRHAAAIGPDIVSWPAAHARLALVQGGPECPPPAMGAARTRLGPVYYVAAKALERLPAAAYGVARRTAILVLPVAVAGPAGAGKRGLAPSFEVAGCVGYVIQAQREGYARSARARGAVQSASGE